MAMPSVKEKILELLSDGNPHSREEIHALCGPSRYKVVTSHISVMRKSLRPRGEDILCELFGGRIHYRWVRLLASPYKE